EGAGKAACGRNGGFDAAAAAVGTRAETVSAGQARRTVTVLPLRKRAVTVAGANRIVCGRHVESRHESVNRYERFARPPAAVVVVRAGAACVHGANAAVTRTLRGSTRRAST